MTMKDDMLPYYPGDSAVDIVGVDGYNFGDYSDQWGYRHHWQDFRGVFERSLVAINMLCKPVWITEAGCPRDARRPGWIADLTRFMSDNPCVDAMLWFNAHKPGEPDFRLEEDSASLAEMRAWLAN
jgi:mannan endo-1,4-beta-mannosidase